MAAENGNAPSRLTEPDAATDVRRVEAMPNAGEPPAHGVYGRLFREGYQFDFYQAVRLLERYFADAPAPGETADVRRERIRFRPDAALGFPATDVRTVDYEAADDDPEAARARLTVTFLGLYGIDSPLPVYFYEDLATRPAETEPLRDFLDIFNHRLYAYFYRAWKKYRPELREALETSRHGRRFLSTAGLATAGALAGAPFANRMRLSAFAGRLAPHARNAEGLRALLAGFLTGIGVEVEENVPRWVPIPERPRMGAGGVGLALGTTATVGERVFDLAGKFRLVLGPVAFSAFEAFLPGGARARLVHYLVRLYAPDYLDYDVALKLRTDGIPPVRLGSAAVRMGQTMWLGTPAEPITTQYLEYE